MAVIHSNHGGVLKGTLTAIDKNVITLYIPPDKKQKFPMRVSIPLNSIMYIEWELGETPFEVI